MEYVTWGLFLKVKVKGQGHQRSKVKFTFLVITQKLPVVSTWNKDHWIPLDQPHKNAAHTFLRMVHRFRDICDFAFFRTLDEIHIFGHNWTTIGRSGLKQEPLDCSRRAAQKWYCRIFSSDAPFSRYLPYCGFFVDFLVACRNFTLSYHFENVITQRISFGIIRIYLLV